MKAGRFGGRFFVFFGRNEKTGEYRESPAAPREGKDSRIGQTAGVWRNDSENGGKIPERQPMDMYCGLH